MNEPNELEYCQYGDHWTAEYINYFTNGCICESCAESEVISASQNIKYESQQEEVTNEQITAQSVE